MASQHRRVFMKTTVATGLGLAAFSMPSFASRSTRGAKLRVLSIGVVGTIGAQDRRWVQSHPDAEIVGLCDVDEAAIAQAAQDHPEAFQCRDYREAFDQYGDRFDAVIVSTPDHSHCSIMTAALAHNKHVYGQKPLVQQLEEVEFLQRAVKAKPGLVTQTGAQRIESQARRAAVDILKQGILGPVIEVHVAYGGGALAGGHYFADGQLGEPIQPPAGIDYDLWLNGAQMEPCRPNMVRRRWRSWWNYGGGQIADWVVHLTDVLYYAFPELKSPNTVCSRTPSRDLTFFHADRVTSTLTYQVESERFANSTCNFHFYDTGLKPDREQLGLPAGDWPGDIFTVVVGTEGVLVLGPSGPIQIWRNGDMTDGLTLVNQDDYPKINHWHAWVDAALGRETVNRLWAPFTECLKPTEAGLLAVKAAKFPGQVLRWDRDQLSFPNSEAATSTLVRRTYRAGFEPVRL